MDRQRSPIGCDHLAKAGLWRHVSHRSIPTVPDWGAIGSGVRILSRPCQESARGHESDVSRNCSARRTFQAVSMGSKADGMAVAIPTRLSSRQQLTGCPSECSHQTLLKRIWWRVKRSTGVGTFRSPNELHGFIRLSFRIHNHGHNEYRIPV